MREMMNRRIRAVSFREAAVFVNLIPVAYGSVSRSPDRRPLRVISDCHVAFSAYPR